MRFAFGDHELDEGRFELRRGGRVVPVQPKVLELLLHLVRHAGRVVSREELLETVWADVVVTDSSLARAVSLARRAIGQDGPTAITTVARRGYRFEGAVRTFADPGPAADPAAGYVGRVRLLAETKRALEGALAGRGRILLLVGEAGIGKTRTAGLLAEWGRQARAEVSTSWGLEPRAPTCWSWTRLLQQVGRASPRALASLSATQRADLARIAPELGGEPTPAASGSEGDTARFRRFDSVRELLERAARARPLVLVLDDLHAADAETLWLLDYVARDLERHPIAIVATCREEVAGRAPEQARALERILRAPCLERWPLAGLHDEELRVFVDALVEGDPEPALLEALARQTGGNPLLLGESLRSLDARGLLEETRASEAWEALLPRGIGHLLSPKLAQLSSEASDTLACAAAIGVEVDRALLVRCAPDSTGLQEPLGELVEAGLLEFVSGATALRFPHVLLREALYAELVPRGEPRKALHARIATALEGDASEAALAARAFHACEAAPRVDPSRAAALAAAAARRAAGLHDFVQAATWYERTLAMHELVPASDLAERAALLSGLGSALVRAASVERARAAFRRALALARSAARGDLLAEAALGFAHRPHSTGRGDPEVTALLEEALDGLTDATPALRSRVRARLAAELRYTAPERAEALAALAMEEARSCDDAAALANVLDDCTFARWSSADPEGWLALNSAVARAADNAGDRDLALAGQKGCVTAHLELGDLAGARRAIRSFEAAARGVATPQARWWVAMLHACEALADADLENAELHIDESIRIAAQSEVPEMGLEMQAQLVYLRTEQDRAEEILPAAREQVRRYPDQTAWRAALAKILVAAGRPLEARDALAPLVGSRFAEVPRDRGWLPTHALAAEVVAACGDVAVAERLENLLAPHARLGVVVGSALYYGPVTYFLGLLAAVRARWDAALGLLDEALAATQRADAVAWTARVQVARARAHLARDGAGDRVMAGSLAGDALATASRRHLVRIAAEAREIESALWARGSEQRRGRRARGVRPRT